MSDVKFLTHEIGSLAKPPWLTKSALGRELDESDIEHARTWGEKVGVDGHEELVELLQKGGADLDQIARWSSRYCVRLQESAGVEVIWDGEQLRSEMYAWAIEHAKGFEERGTVRSFDNKYYTKSAAVGPVGLATPYHNDEFSFLQSVAKHQLKIPVTGAYTLAVWSYDEHHTPKEGRIGAGYGRSKEIEARRELTLDIARNLVRPNLEALIDLGATWIQIDEPGASTEADELDLFVESFNVSVEGLDCMFSTHLCFSDYDLFFPAIEGMGGCRQYCVGFANYDRTRARRLGRRPARVRGDLEVPRPAVRPDPRARRARHPHRLHRAARARSRPDPLRGRGLRRPCTDPRLPGLRPAYAQLGRRLREAPGDGRGHAAGRRSAQPRPRVGIGVAPPGRRLS